MVNRKCCRPPCSALRDDVDELALTYEDVACIT
jgi:hypothetical protein